MLSFSSFCRGMLLLIVASLPVLPAVAGQAAAAKKTVTGTKEPPPSSKIEAGREILVSQYARARFSDANSELKYCMLKSATVTFLEANDKYAFFQVKTSGGIAANYLQACGDGVKVAMHLNEFDNMLNSADREARQASEKEKANNSLLDLLKK